MTSMGDKLVLHHNDTYSQEGIRLSNTAGTYLKLHQSRIQK